MHISALNHSVGEVKDRLSQEKGNMIRKSDLRQMDGLITRGFPLRGALQQVQGIANATNFFLLVCFGFSIIRRHPLPGSQKSFVHLGKHLPPHLSPNLPSGQDLLQNLPKYPGAQAANIN